jgi:26S proteasome regulatory subunit N9
MALIDSVFRRPAGDRVIPFTTIAHETTLPAHEVEHLVMKALSLKLIQGSIDQVSQTTKITWVQPRVLDRKQIEGLRQRLEEWSAKVEKVGQATITNAPELFVQ